jgi:transcription-repair coupling factor (superfamily II helicase)
VLLALTAGEDEADELARDLAFFLDAGGGGQAPALQRAQGTGQASALQRAQGTGQASALQRAQGTAVPNGAGSTVLRIPADPVLPYDDLSPDRGLEMERLAALARLHLDPGAVKAVVVSARGLARRMVPRAAFERHTELVGKGVALDREAFAAKLVALGYARVPLVEDPGTFAVRGGIIDLWSPAAERPVRLELFGDEVESARAFEPEGQRTLGEVDEVVVIPAREALFTAEAKEAAKQAVRDAAERIDRPTSRVREVLDAIDAGTPFFGLEALLPGFHAGGLATLFDYLPADRAAWVDGADAVETALAELDAELRREHEATLRRDDLALPPTAHFLTQGEVEARLAEAPRARRLARRRGAAPVRLRRHVRAAGRDPGRPRRRGRAHPAHPPAR